MLSRVLVAGTGSMAHKHVDWLRTLLPDASVCVLRHRQDRSLKSAAPESYVDTLEEALAFAPQAAIVATPASTHVDIGLPLVRAGIHLLVEKPIADSSAGVHELIRAARRANVVLMTAYNLRFLRSLISLRDHVTSGDVGRVLSVRAEVGQFLPEWRTSLDYRRSVSAQKKLGGGVLLELSHEFDYLRWMFGEFDSVSACIGRLGDLDIDVEDTAHLLLSFRRERSPIACVSLDFLRRDSTRRCTVIGSEGTLRWDALAGTVALFAAGSPHWKSLFVDQAKLADSYRDQLKHFVRCIEGREDVLVSGEDGLAVLQLVEAAFRASSTGTRVSLCGSSAKGEDETGNGQNELSSMWSQ